MFLGTKSASPKRIRKRSRVFLGTASENFPKVSLSEKNSGTFPSVFGDCFRKFPKVSLSEKNRKRSRVFLGTVSEHFPQSLPPRTKIRERSRVFLGTASENISPQSQPIRKKFGNAPECFWGLLQKISPNVCLPKKNSRMFPSVLGTASENFTQSPPP